MKNDSELTRLAEEANRSVRDFEAQMKPLRQFIAQHAERMRQQTETIQKVVREVGQKQIDFVKSMQSSIEPMRRLLQPILEKEQRFGRLENAGWLPHRTIMVDELTGDETVGETNAWMELYLDANWANISKYFLQEVESLPINDETKAVFREAVQAHGDGLFRCVPRVLFPEIERLARHEIFDGRLKTITSQRDLIRLIGELPISQVSTDALAIYIRFTEHVYANATTEDAVAKFERSPIPNRHTTIHGLVSYNTRQQSWNALVLAEFAFRQICVVRDSLVEFSAADDRPA